MKANTSPAKANTGREPLLSTRSYCQKREEREGGDHKAEKVGIIRHLADKRQSNLKMEDGHGSSPDLGIPLRRHVLAKMFYRSKTTKLRF